MDSFYLSRISRVGYRLTNSKIYRHICIYEADLLYMIFCNGQEEKKVYVKKNKINCELLCRV